MSNLAEQLIEPLADTHEDEFEVTITIRSYKHDCNTCYRLSKWEIENDKLHEIVRFMTYRLEDFIKEKQNASSEREESKNAQRLQ